MNRSKDIHILGIESSCDDTCASVVKNGREILSNVVSSQNEIHRKYGGIVPEIASRKHIEMINIVLEEAVGSAGIKTDEIDAVAVTNRPGLIGSLLVGVGAAKAISYAMDIPLIAIDHLRAHIYSNLLVYPQITGNFIGLIISGGHTSLYYSDESRDIKEIGHTLDDAAGEAFDKIARFLGIGYPGGPVIDNLSKNGNPAAIDFPRPMLESGDLNFSFSGLKTAFIYKTQKNRDMVKEENIPDTVASFQEAIIDVLVNKAIKAAKIYKTKNILICGGVAANSRLREVFRENGDKNGINMFIPPKPLCMDNAAMVSCLGYHKYINKTLDSLDIDVYSKSEF